MPLGHRAPNLVLKWEVDPFEPFHLAGDLERANRTRNKALFAFHGESVEAMRHRTNSTSGDIELEWQGEVPLVVPGLRSGARFVLGLRSAIEEAVLLEQEVTVPTTPGTLDISLASEAYTLRGIQLVALSAEGEPLAAAAYAAKRPDDHCWSTVQASAWPLPDGPLQFQAGASGGWGERGLLAPGAGTEEPQTSHKYTAEAVGASSLELPLFPGAHVLEVRAASCAGTTTHGASCARSSSSSSLESCRHSNSDPISAVRHVPTSSLGGGVRVRDPCRLVSATVNGRHEL